MKVVCLVFGEEFVLSPKHRSGHFWSFKLSSWEKKERNKKASPSLSLLERN